MKMNFAEPLALASALSTVLEQHPYPANGELSLTSDRLLTDAQALWDRLAALSLGKRRNAVGRLGKLEARILAATARARFDWEPCFSILADLFLHHVVPQGRALAWEALLMSDGISNFREYAAPHLEVATSATATWTVLLNSVSPSQAAAQLYSDADTVFDVWAQSSNVCLGQYEQFLNLVKSRILNDERAVGAADSREKSESIAYWATTLIPLEQLTAWEKRFLASSFQARSMIRTEVQPWPTSHAVLKSIYERHQEPAVGSEFWNSVPDRVRTAFICWCRDRELTQAIGQNDRLVFWQRYVSSLKRTETNTDRTVVFIRFEHWFAVQFTTAGTATYLFGSEFFLHLRRKNENFIKTFVRHNKRSIGTYKHQGHKAKWQESAAAVVAKVQQAFEEGRE